MLAAESIELPTGVTLEYVEHGDPSGAVLILLHAIADSRRIFEPLLSHLSRSVHAFSLSQRGHGDSSRPEGGYRLEDFSKDLAAFMDALDLNSAVIAGGSSGGVNARRFVIDHPSRVRGLLSLGSPFRLRDKPMVREMWETVFARLADPVDPVMVRDFAVATIGESVAPSIIDMVVEENLKAPAIVWRETMKGLLDDTSSDELHRIAVPTLVCWGDQDPIVPRTDQESLLAAIPGSRLLVYQRLGHAFYLEDPRLVATDIEAFIDSLGGPLESAVVSTRP